MFKKLRSPTELAGIHTIVNFALIGEGEWKMLTISIASNQGETELLELAERLIQNQKKGT